MAEGPEEARGRPPGPDGEGGGRPAATPGLQDGPQPEPQDPGLAPEPPCAPRKRREAAPASPAGPQAAAGAARLSAREYSRQVHEWLWQSYCGYLTWHSGLAAFPAYCGPPLPQASHPGAPAGAPLAYYSPFYFLGAGASGPDPGAAAGVASPAAVAAPVPGLGPRAPHVQGSARTTAASRAGPAAPARATETGRQAGREYVIPSLAHRFMAEMVDFFILFFIKATIVLSFMHLSGIKDISKFAMHYIIEEIDEDTSMEDLQKMMVVALIYRLLVCFYEIICIWGAGGATPGKFLLGLRVVTCDTSVLIAPSRVLVIPSSNVSITTSTIRALIKNFSIASFFPAFITLLFFQHNRTAYDIVAGTIVVKRNGVR
ncbi:protein FAM8A1 [Ctenodactylus gundi]